MSDRMSQVLEVAKTLSREEQAEVIGRLLDTLDGTETPLNQVKIDTAWGVECERRFAAYRRGEMTATPVEDVLDRLKPRDSQ